MKFRGYTVAKLLTQRGENKECAVPKNGTMVGFACLLRSPLRGIGKETDILVLIADGMPMRYRDTLHRRIR